MTSTSRSNPRVLQPRQHGRQGILRDHHADWPRNSLCGSGPKAAVNLSIVSAWIMPESCKVMRPWPRAFTTGGSNAAGSVARAARSTRAAEDRRKRLETASDIEDEGQRLVFLCILKQKIGQNRTCHSHSFRESGCGQRRRYEQFLGGDDHPIWPCTGRFPGHALHDLSIVTNRLNQPAGDFYVVPPAWCGFTLLSSLLTNVTTFTNVVVSTNTAGVVDIGQIYYRHHHNPDQRHAAGSAVLLWQQYRPVVRSPRRGPGAVLRANYDSLLGQFFQPLWAKTRRLWRRNCQQIFQGFDTTIWTWFRPGTTRGHAAVSPDVSPARQFPIGDWKI